MATTRQPMAIKHVRPWLRHVSLWQSLARLWLRHVRLWPRICCITPRPYTHTYTCTYTFTFTHTCTYMSDSLAASSAPGIYVCVCVFVCVCLCVCVRVCVCKRRTLWQPARHHPQAISGAREAGYLCQSFLYFLPAPVVLGAQRRQMHEDFPHELSHLHTSLSPISRSTLGKARMGRRIRGPSNSQRATATQQQHVQQGRAASLKV